MYVCGLVQDVSIGKRTTVTALLLCCIDIIGTIISLFLRYILFYGSNNLYSPSFQMNLLIYYFYVFLIIFIHQELGECEEMFRSDVARQPFYLEVFISIVMKFLSDDVVFSS